jgi:hypothetical protein
MCGGKEENLKRLSQSEIKDKQTLKSLWKPLRDYGE